MLRPLIILLFTVVTSISAAQTQESEIRLRPTNGVYFDLFGGGSIFSANYEKLFLSREKSFFTFKVGAGYTRGKSDANIGVTNHEIDAGIGVFDYSSTKDYSAPTNHLSLPAHLSLNIGKGKHFFEFGIHYTYYVPAKSVIHTYGPMFGYRFQPTQSGKAIFRFYINLPMVNFTEIHWYSPVGISFGLGA